MEHCVSLCVYCVGSTGSKSTNEQKNVEVEKMLTMTKAFNSNHHKIYSLPNEKHFETQNIRKSIFMMLMLRFVELR